MKVTKNLFNNYIVTPDEGDAYVVPSWDTEKHAEMTQYLADNPDCVEIYQPTKIEYMAKINEEKMYLENTDWYIVRNAETGVQIPAEVLAQRAQARLNIGNLEAAMEGI